MEKQVTQAGQINFLGCDILSESGVATNVTPQVERITIFEDIFSPFISGEITLRDTYDIPNAIGLSSKLLLRLDLNTPSLPNNKNINGYFLIYNLTNRELASDRSQLYTYRFASEEIIYDVQRRISKTFRGTGKSIIEELVSKKLGSNKRVNGDDSENELVYTSNFWSPTQNFRYIIEHSKDNEGNPSYVFFENRDGFNFKSLSSIAKGGKSDLMQYLVASDFIADVETSLDNKIRFGASTRNPNSDYSIIRELRVDSTFDILDFLSKGGSRTLLYTHDLVTKRIDIQKFDLVNDNHNKLNDKRFLSDTVISTTEPLIMTGSKYWNVSDKGDMTNTRFLQKRVSQMAQFESFKIEVDIFGRTDYTAGEKVYLDINQIRPIAEDEEKEVFLDRMYSGTYIVSKIAHHITRKEHMATLELIKDSTILKNGSQ